MSQLNCHYKCSCAQAQNPANSSVPHGQRGKELQQSDANDYGPRLAFSLYPLEHLLFCEECHEIRCPRCTVEEIVCWYCPSCLFEVASSVVKVEGNRCTRNCFNCPICTAALSVAVIDPGNRYILSCEHCSWTTLEIGYDFERPTNIFSQLFRKKSPDAGDRSPTQIARREQSFPNVLTDDFGQFAKIRSFYRSQISDFSLSNPQLSPSAEPNLNSPSSLARIMSLYTNDISLTTKNSHGRPNFTEARDSEEGLSTSGKWNPTRTTALLRTSPWDVTAAYRRQCSYNQSVRFLSELFPVPTLLRTKRSRRCRACRHILVRPEPKVSSTRHRILLAAPSYVPALTIQSLPRSLVSSSESSSSVSSRFQSRFILTIKNPIFDPIKVRLATSMQIQDLVNGRVTIICPQFEVGANTDVWDEALGERARIKGTRGLEVTSGSRTLDPGTIWERGRNWTSVILEIEGLSGLDQNHSIPQIFEIPFLVGVEYETNVDLDYARTQAHGLERKEKKELEYWAFALMGV